MSNQTLSGACILVVEDEPLIALDVCQTLKNAGAKVVGPAMTVTAARALCVDGALAAAILDVRLGHELVFPIATWLAERNIPFVFHTGGTGGRDLRAEWPGREVLSKPVRPATLVGTIARLLGSS